MQCLFGLLVLVHRHGELNLTEDESRVEFGRLAVLGDRSLERASDEVYLATVVIAIQSFDAGVSTDPYEHLAAVRLVLTCRDRYRRQQSRTRKTRKLLQGPL